MFLYIKPPRIIYEVILTGKSSRGGRHPEESVLWQEDVLGAQADLKVALVVAHAVVEHHLVMSILKVFFCLAM